MFHRLLAEGNSTRAIAADLGLARNTIRPFACATDPEQLLVDDSPGRLAGLLVSGCSRDFARLW